MEKNSGIKDNDDFTTRRGTIGGIKIFDRTLSNRGNGMIRDGNSIFASMKKGIYYEVAGERRGERTIIARNREKKGPRPVSGRVYVTHVNASCRKIIVHVDAGTHVRRKFFTSVQHSP